ncbi:hypothetical protein ACFYVL_00160 [Streptomyces sp. NPDC004111]|uniref:hypothetical protein n=1 Tax=Streptomyces sp. NPDC004111 TaxID=3364690 RepID=UPI00367940ED
MAQNRETPNVHLPAFGIAPRSADEEAADRGISAQALGGVGLGEGWADLPNGTFATEDPADLIDYRVEKKAVSDAVVEFTLFIGHTSSGWAKAIIMPDGLGSQWEIRAQGRGASASNGLWAHQVKHGQVLTFRKPKGFGIWHDVIQIGFLGALDPGDRVVFTWRHD